MAKIKRDLKKKKILDKASAGSSVIRACDGNAGLGNIASKLADFTAANDALSAALRAVNAARAHAETLTLLQNEAEAAWNEKFESLCSAIESETHGDSGKIVSAGLTAYERGHKPKIGKLAAPGDLRAKAGEFDGEARLRWENVPGRFAFVVEVGEQAEGAAERVWRNVATTTQCKVSVKGLTPGQLYYFRVAAVGTAGRGPWSDPALCRAA